MTFHMPGDLQIGGVEPMLGTCPTPRFVGDTCYLPPRQHAYGFEEIGRHISNQPPIETRYFGPKCPSCGSRRTKRLAEGYPVRVCIDCQRHSLYGELIPEKGPKP